METHTFVSRLEERIHQYDLLCHPFYKAWSAGELTRDDLRAFLASRFSASSPATLARKQASIRAFYAHRVRMGYIAREIEEPADAPELGGIRARRFTYHVTARGRSALNRTDVYARVPGQGTVAHCDVDFAIGACQVFRRAAFDAVGGVDDTAAFGPEDVDFCLRIRDAGWRVLQVAA